MLHGRGAFQWYNRERLFKVGFRDLVVGSVRSNVPTNNFIRKFTTTNLSKFLTSVRLNPGPYNSEGCSGHCSSFRRLTIK